MELISWTGSENHIDHSWKTNPGSARQAGSTGTKKQPATFHRKAEPSPARANPQALGLRARGGGFFHDNADRPRERPLCDNRPVTPQNGGMSQVRQLFSFTALGCAVLMLAPAGAAGTTPILVDDFNDGNDDGWTAPSIASRKEVVRAFLTPAVSPTTSEARRRASYHGLPASRVSMGTFLLERNLLERSCTCESSEQCR